jgi:hypothetical protein
VLDIDSKVSKDGELHRQESSFKDLTPFSAFSGDVSPFPSRGRGNSILGFQQNVSSSFIFDQSKVFNFKDNTDLHHFAKLNTIEKAAIYYNPSLLD